MIYKIKIIATKRIKKIKLKKNDIELEPLKLVKGK